MKFSMTGQEKVRLFNTGDCLTEVTTCAGLTVTIYDYMKSHYQFWLYVVTLVSSNFLCILTVEVTAADLRGTYLEYKRARLECDRSWVRAPVGTNQRL
jgi:hypothetical protein